MKVTKLSSNEQGNTGALQQALDALPGPALTVVVVSKAGPQYKAYITCGGVLFKAQWRSGAWDDVAGRIQEALGRA